jgi:hypothetical protein
MPTAYKSRYKQNHRELSEHYDLESQLLLS